jgi:hypothetical protein
MQTAMEKKLRAPQASRGLAGVAASACAGAGATGR